MSTEAVREAQAVLEVYWGGYDICQTPVDPVIIARDLGINVYETRMPNDLSGCIVKEPERGPEIFVNSQHSPVRQRFTVAHELGHYFGRGQIGKDEFYLRRDDLASSGTDPEEIYANAFAAELLAPEIVVRRLVGQGWNRLQIAKHLGISLESLGYRLITLGLTAA